ncbi:ABC transporter ATP-binding protein [Paenibacillus periandrae]|uniref:ABC transporter ATP-binding protein n=1 Tax=Paenibacillus periandrae TaxID=1761741 RepID=UPI001F0965FE|nr:ABC transporter ATP-binding protein [Paenibacillus periandrae]
MAFGNVAAERAAIEMTYEGLCTVTEFVKTKDPDTKANKQQATPVLLNQPCALSQASLPAAGASDTANEINYDAKLFISPDVTIQPGSLITVTQDGMTFKGKHAGEPFRYPTHQEIMLKRVDRA